LTPHVTARASDNFIRLNQKEALIGILGLGYVGLPLMRRFTEVGYRVLGFDIDPLKVDKLNAGETYIEHIPAASLQAALDAGFQATTDFSRARDCDALILCVPTPLNKYREPDLRYVLATTEAKISVRTKAILPVSLYGQPADLDAINAIAARHGLPVIEDAAQSYGATYKSRQSGNLSTLGCTSFFPSKPLGGYGDGGAILTSDDALAQACREIRVHGQSQRYVHTRIGVGGRMDTLQCAIALAKLDRFDREIAQRQAVARRYHELLATDTHGSTRIDEEPIRVHPCSSVAKPLPWPQPDRTSVFAQYTLRVPDRAALQARLQAAGIPTAVHYPVPLNEQPAYAHLCCPDCTPVARQMAREVISLPMHPDLNEVDQDRIVSAIAAVPA
jgi:UDP-2-acetamido-2-deoxy-ribo-hexuluronate aminotransferase